MSNNEAAKEKKAAIVDDHETCDKETALRKATFPGPGSQRGLGEGGPLVGTTIPPGPSPLRGPGSSMVRQPVGECDPESELQFSCPRRTFVDPPEEIPMAATANNRKALEEFIRKHYKMSAFNTCKRQSKQGYP